MSFVIDNSMAMAWVLPDEWSPAADTVLDRVVNEGGHIPTSRADRPAPAVATAYPI